MTQAAKEHCVTIDRVHQINEKRLRKLKTGRARRELLKIFAIAETGLYQDRFNHDREHNFTSIVERML